MKSIFFLAITFTVLVILPTSYSLPSVCITLQAAPLTAQLSAQIIATGNDPQCYSAIVAIIPELCYFLNATTSFSNNISDPTVLIAAFKKLIHQSSFIHSQCGVTPGVYALRETTFQEKYCIENTQTMVPLATSALEEIKDLDISIPALNNLYYYMSYALNTCGGITTELYDNEDTVNEFQSNNEADVRTFLAEIYTS